MQKRNLVTGIMFFIFLQIFIEVKSQTISNGICSYSEFDKSAQLCDNNSFNSFSSNTIAEQEIDKILLPIGLKRNFILIPCDNIKNCAAVTLKNDGGRYIIYDKGFLNNIQLTSNSRWTSLSILAHEIGHHLDGHTLKQTSKIMQREEELEADEFSGFILYKLGANLNDAQAAINAIQHPSCNEDFNFTHPCLDKRLLSVKIGWQKAASLDGKRIDMINVANELVDPTEKIILENINNQNKIFDYYSRSFNSGIRTFNEHDWKSSSKYFSDAVKYSDVIFQNKWAKDRTMIMDTTSILYAGYAFQNLNLLNEANRYYSRLINSRVKGDQYKDIYKFVIINSMNNKDATQFYYFLGIAKSVYPNEKWDDYKIEFIDRNNNASEKKELYIKEDKDGNLNELDYLRYGEMFNNSSVEFITLNPNSIVNDYNEKSLEAYKKAYTKNPQNPISSFNIGIIYYNMFNAYGDMIFTEKKQNVKPNKTLENLQLKSKNSAKEWLTISFDTTKNKTNLSETENKIQLKSKEILEFIRNNN